MNSRWKRNKVEDNDGVERRNLNLIIHYLRRRR
jgi:hypothetical protein